MTDPEDIWAKGRLALQLLMIHPTGLQGIHVRARASDLRDAFLSGIPKYPRLSPNVSDIQLFGGVDIGATLQAGSVVRSQGLVGTPGLLTLTMAERVEVGLAARLAQVLDRQGGHALVLLDEGANADETPTSTLTQRVAFFVDLDGLRLSDVTLHALSDTCRTDPKHVHCSDDAIIRLVVTAARFGIDNLRAPLLALEAAKAKAALHNRKTVNDDDLRTACELVYPQRATLIPENEDDVQAPPDTSEEQPEKDQDHSQDDSLGIPDEILIDAIKAVLPPDLMASLASKSASKQAKGSGSGDKRKGNRRGRPLPSRPGKPSGANRIDIIATLRAAAPWQPIRRKQTPDRKGLLIRQSDIHIRRYQERSDRLIIFAVDASGSAAVARLAEAKGAIELMLAEAYARRDHVALISFRGDVADVILPPTRSLVQTKRRLAAVPGGGGTPLAAGLQAAATLATQSKGKGLSPSLALLTDGRANVPLPGRTGRAAATEDALQMAGLVRAMDMPSAIVDTSVRPHRDLQALSQTLGGTYLPLPRADAQGLSKAIGSALATE